jgi:HD-GYP domain-containing protein (c-di-GMP phosphodiesterase class II)
MPAAEMAIKKLVADSGQRFDPEVVNAFVRVWGRKEFHVVASRS